MSSNSNLGQAEQTLTLFVKIRGIFFLMHVLKRFHSVCLTHQLAGSSLMQMKLFIVLSCLGFCI